MAQKIRVIKTGNLTNFPTKVRNPKITSQVPKAQRMIPADPTNKEVLIGKRIINVNVIKAMAPLNQIQKLCF